MSKLAATQVLYRERVTPKWSNFLPIFLVFPTFWLTFAPINALFGMALGAFLTVIIAALMIFKAPMVIITTSKIRVGRAQIPLKLAGKTVLIPQSEAFKARGPELDARAYVSLQSSRKGLLRMEINDPSDPTPYWLFSCKKPESVLEALVKAKN